MSVNSDSSFKPKTANLMSSSQSLLARIVGIDARTLAVFRIALALVLLSDLYTRFTSIAAFYSDKGVLPRSAQLEIYSNLPWLFSLHLMSGLVIVQVFLFGIAFIAGLGILVGYRTNWSIFISWILLVSLHNRNMMVLQGGDAVIRLLLFWSLFLPLHARLSVDRLLYSSESHSKNSYPPVVLTVGTLAALLQVCFIYWFSYTLKSDISWRSEGSALYYALNIDQLTRPLGRMLLHYPTLMGSLTVLTMLIERFGPILALLPFWRVRVLGVLIFFGFHLCLGLVMTLGIFPWAACVAWLLFIPGEFWNRLEQLASSPTSFVSRIRSSINSILKMISYVVIACGFDSFKEDKTTTIKPDKTSLWHNLLKQGIFSQGIAAAFLIYIFCWNLTTVDATRYGMLIPSGWNSIGLLIRTDQAWNMFAPYPLRADGWYVMPAHLVNGKEVDIMRDGAAVNWKKPLNVANMYHNTLWWRYMLNLNMVSNSAHRRYFAEYIIRQWNESHGPNEKIRSLSIVFMLEKTPDYNPSADYNTDFPVKKLVLWNMNG